MRSKKFILFLLVVTLGLCGKTQDKQIKFRSITSAGLLIGESGTDMMLQTVNGIACKNYFSGIGFGTDYYHFNSYPLFFDQRVYFGKNNKVFVYGDLGYNFSAKNKPGKEIYYYTSYHFNGGVYTDLGFGYRMKIKGKLFFTLSTGFTYKEINDKVGTSTLCLTPEPCPVDYSTYKYGNGRVVLKAGVDF